MKRGTTQGKAQAPGRSLDPIVGRFSFAEFLGSFSVRDPMGGVIALCSKSKYAEEIVDALNAMRDSKEKCKRNRDNWKKRAEAAEAKVAWLPIETAPKCKKAILVFRSDNLCAYCATWDDITNEWRHFGGSSYPIGGEVTHWMQLPNPPNPEGLRTRHLVEGTREPFVQPSESDSKSKGEIK
jgi:hypothetical protein